MARLDGAGGGRRRRWSQRSPRRAAAISPVRTRGTSSAAAATAPTELDAYRPHLDLLWDCFGAERLVYGSNWPVCNRCGDPEEVYAAQLDVLTEWAAGKGAATVEGLFWRNALEAYRYDDSREHA